MYGMFLKSPFEGKSVRRFNSV